MIRHEILEHAAAMLVIGRVHTGDRDADQHLARAGGGHVGIFVGKDFRAAMAMDAVCLHGNLS